MVGAFFFVSEVCNLIFILPVEIILNLHKFAQGLSSTSLVAHFFSVAVSEETGRILFGQLKLVLGGAGNIMWGRLFSYVVRPVWVGGEGAVGVSGLMAPLHNAERGDIPVRNILE